MNIVTHRTADGWRLFLGLLPIIGIIWLHLFLRLHNIGDSLPYFIDEIRHIERARIVWTFEDIHISTTPSKFGTYYWLGLFGLPEYPDPWIGRAPVALFTILGIAGSFALGKTMFGRGSGLLAALMVSVWPFLLFFERLALTDPPTAAIVVITMWWSMVVAKRPTQSRALVLGGLISLMLAGKLLSMMLFLGPFMAIAFFGHDPFQLNRPWGPQIRNIQRLYWPYILRAGLVIAVVWGAIFGIYIIRRIINPHIRYIVDSYLYEGATGEENFALQNIERVEQVLYYHWSLLLCGLAILAVATLWRRNWREPVFFLLLIVPFNIFLIIIARELSTRYLTIIAHLAAVGIAGGIVKFIDLWRNTRWVGLGYAPLGLALIWVVTFGLPFAVGAMQDPESLALPDRDQVEYFRNYTGYAIPEAFELVAEDSAATIADQEPVVMAVMRICDHHPYYFMPDDLRDELNVNCQPRAEGENHNLWFQRRYEWINAGTQQYGQVYLVAEQFPNPEGSIAIDPKRIKGSVKLMGRFERPHNGIPVDVYKIYEYSSIALDQENGE